MEEQQHFELLDRMDVRGQEAFDLGIEAHQLPRSAEPEFHHLVRWYTGAGAG